ncbi:MAG: alpha/beta hydrolase [Fibrobacteres bacterium]|nr:alpha/beta hydrolase [Fibrobacterota bacterium]
MFAISGSARRLPAIGTFWAMLAMATLAQQEILLWPKGAPLANGTLSTGTASTGKPSITPFPASKPNGAAMVIFPGGAYVSLSSTYEGNTPAQWLASKGVSGFVVKYRLGSNGYHHPVEMWDGQRAVRWVHAHAAEYGIDTSRIGVLGFSAGGHLASTVSTHYDNGNPSAADSVDRHPCRPAVSILGYPVITMQSSFTHLQSRDNLLGPNNSQAMIDSLSSEKQVNDKTPPAFLFHAIDDGAVPIKNPQSYYDSLQKHHIPASFMKFDHGGHGFGMADGQQGAPNDSVLHTWCDSSLKWMDKQGFFTAKSTSLTPPAMRSGTMRADAVSRRPDFLFEAPDGEASDALGRRP